MESRGKSREKRPAFTTTYAQYLEKSEKASDFSTLPQNLEPPIIEMWKNKLSCSMEYGFSS